MARDLAARLHVASGWLFVGLWVLVVAGLASPRLVPAGVAETVLVALSALALLKASPHIRALATVLLVLTALAALRTGGLDPVLRGVRASLAIGAFLPVVALVRLTVLESPAVPAIRARVGAMSGPERRAWMTGGAHLLGAVLTLAYVSVLRPMLPAALEDGERTALAECGTRGLGLAVQWSPFFVASAVAGQLVPGVPAWQTVALGLALAGLGGAIAHLMFNRALGARALARALVRLGPIVPATLALVGLVTGVGTVTGWNVLQSVIVVVPAACAAYLAARTGARAARVLPAVAAASGRMGDEVLIFVASTVFGSTVAALGMPDGLAQALQAGADRPGLVIAASVAAIVAFGVAGLHPMVGATIVVPACVALRLPIAELVLAQIVVLSWGLSSTIAAWTLPVVVTSSAFGVPVRRLVFGANLRFVAVFGLAAVLALAGINRLLSG